MRAFAVVRALEVISEASRRLPMDLKQRHPDVPWVQIAAAGNIYRHEYEDVDYELVWQTAQRGLGTLKRVVEAELQSLSETR